MRIIAPLCVLFLLYCSTEKTPKQNKQEDFQPSYTVISYEKGFASQMKARITVPLGLSKEQLDLNFKHALHAIQNKYGTNEAIVYVYRQNDPVNISYTVGKAKFAENNNYEIEFNNLYFKPLPKDRTGDTVILVNGISGNLKGTILDNHMVKVSNMSDEWGKSNIVITAPDSTIAYVLETKIIPLGDVDLVRCKIKLRINSKEYEGWVMGNDAVNK